MMDRIALRLAAAALLLGSAACATAPQGPAGRPIPENFARIAVNKTTANQVRDLLGPPSRILRSRAHQGEEWGYRYAEDFERRMFWVEISQDGVVRETSRSTDFETDRRYLGR
jgi:hypothetical protein